jgi:hypothetical protein
MVRQGAHRRLLVWSRARTMPDYARSTHTQKRKQTDRPKQQQRKKAGFFGSLFPSCFLSFFLPFFGLWVLCICFFGCVSLCLFVVSLFLCFFMYFSCVGGGGFVLFQNFFSFFLKDAHVGVNKMG